MYGYRLHLTTWQPPMILRIECVQDHLLVIFIYCLVFCMGTGCLLLLGNLLVILGSEYVQRHILVTHRLALNGVQYYN